MVLYSVISPCEDKFAPERATKAKPEMSSKEDPAFVEKASNVTNQPEEILEATNASVLEANPNVLTEIYTLPFLMIEPFEPGSRNSEN